MAVKLPPALRDIKILMTWGVNMEGVHCAPAGAVTAQLWAPMLGDPESVMRMAEVPEDVMAVTGVNVTVAVVAVALAWEPRVMTGPAVINPACVSFKHVINNNVKMLIVLKSIAVVSFLF